MISYVPCMVYLPGHGPLGAMGSTRNIQWSALSPHDTLSDRVGDGKTALQQCGRNLHHDAVRHKALTINSLTTGAEPMGGKPHEVPHVGLATNS